MEMSNEKGLFKLNVYLNYRPIDFYGRQRLCRAVDAFVWSFFTFAAVGKNTSSQQGCKT
jgi:hypothetical protein